VDEKTYKKESKMPRIKRVIFKNTVDREAFISLQSAYLSLPMVSFKRETYEASGPWRNPSDNGKPMLTVEDGLADLPYSEFAKQVSWDIYKDALFKFEYVNKVPGSTHNLIDFTSS